MTYTGAQYLNSTNTLKLPSIAVADFGARYATTMAGRDVVLRGTVSNAFNRSYWLGGFGDGYALVSAPRTVLLSATMDF